MNENIYSTADSIAKLIGIDACDIGSFTLCFHLHCGTSLVMHSGKYRGMVFRPGPNPHWDCFSTLNYPNQTTK